MKSRKTILTLAMCLTLIGSYGQKISDNNVIPVNKVNTVVITNLSGECAIFKSITDEVKAKSELFTKGDSWGWKFPKERPEFRITSKTSNDTLYIDMPVEFNFKTIGINTYSEKIRNVIQIPVNKKIVVKKANKLKFEDEFIDLDIQNTLDLTCGNINKVKVKSIICNANNSLIINDEKISNAFEFQGAGESKYLLDAKKISLTFK